MSVLSKDGIVIQAHRGASAVKTENTLPAFREALLVGAHSVELDVHLTRDGHWVVYHDFLINPGACKLENGKDLNEPWVISEKSLAEIKSLRLLASGTKRTVDASPDNLAEDKIPTLAEVVDDLDKYSEVIGRNIEIDIEIKSDDELGKYSAPAKVLGKKGVQFLRQLSAQTKNPLTVRSFDPRVLEIIRQKMPKQKIAFLSDVGVSDFIDRSRNIKPQIFAPYFGQLTRENVEQAHKVGALVIPWTVNKEEDWAKVLELGGDGITTDHPAKFKKFLESRVSKPLGCDPTFK